MDQFLHQLRFDAQRVESRLDEVLSLTPTNEEVFRPKMLIDAMRHGVLNGGKRLRPFLVMQAGAMFDAEPDNLLQVATALECIHCYSLIHDDLPAMDDDDLRRGKPTVHRAFDEATAILAGDGLLTYAFDLLSDARAHKNASTRLKLIANLAKAAGMGGMVGGQVLDLRPGSKNPPQSQIARMQKMKTGALIRYACQAGGICGSATEQELSALGEYGQYLGQAFQMADDILDATASSQQMGKDTAKDNAQGKLTQVSTLGIDEAQNIAAELVTNACDALAMFGERGILLKAAAHFSIERKS